MVEILIIETLEAETLRIELFWKNKFQAETFVSNLLSLKFKFQFKKAYMTNCPQMISYLALNSRPL